MQKSAVPALLKKQDSEIDELVNMALVYLQAYKDTGDWAYLPTVTNCVGRITIIHMRGNHDAAQSRS